MNRSSFPTSQLWRVVLALCALVSLGVPSVRAQEVKPVPHLSEKDLGAISAEIARIHDPNVRALMLKAATRNGIVSPEYKPFYFVVLARDGRTLAINSYEPHLRIVRAFRMQNGQAEQVLQRAPNEVASGGSLFFNVPFVENAAFSPNGQVLATDIQTIQRQPALALWNTRTWKITRVFPPETNSVSSIAFSSDGRRLAVGNMGGGVHVYDVATGRILLKWHYGTIFKRIFVGFRGGDGKLLALTTNGNYRGYRSNVTPEQIKIGEAEASQVWDVEANEMIAEFPEDGDVRRGAFNSDATQLALVSYDLKSLQKGVINGMLAVFTVATQSTQVFETKAPALPTSLLWTPDDRNIILIGMGEDKKSLHVITPLQTPSTP